MAQAIKSNTSSNLFTCVHPALCVNKIPTFHNGKDMLVIFKPCTVCVQISSFQLTCNVVSDIKQCAANQWRRY